MKLSDQEHYRRLERMFQSAPLNQGIFDGTSIRVGDCEAELKLAITEKYFHAANAMHGAIYFKLLDDSAYFAAASVEKGYFILTKSYTIHFRRPVQLDVLRAEGSVTEVGEKEIIAESKIWNKEGKLVAHGSGIFVKGPTSLVDLPGYSSST